MPGSITLITPQTDRQPPLVNRCSNPISVTCKMHHHFVANFQGFSHARQLVLTRTRRSCSRNFALGPRALVRAWLRSFFLFCNHGHSDDNEKGNPGAGSWIQCPRAEVSEWGGLMMPSAMSAGCTTRADVSFLRGAGITQDSLDPWWENRGFLGSIFLERKATGGQNSNELTFSDFPWPTGSSPNPWCSFWFLPHLVPD